MALANVLDSFNQNIMMKSGHISKACENAASQVYNLLHVLADLDLPGWWILYGQEIYTRDVDIRRHESFGYPGIQIPQMPIYYDGEFPAPDFLDINYWEKKESYLRDMVQKIRDGLIEPKFSPRELFLAGLFQRDLESRSSRVENAESVANKWMELQGLLKSRKSIPAQDSALTSSSRYQSRRHCRIVQDRTRRLDSCFSGFS